MKKYLLLLPGFFLMLYLLSLLYIGLHVYDTTAEKSDVIVVLGALSQYKNEPNPCLVQRVKKAAAVQKNGYAPRMIMSGGVDRLGEESQAELMKKLAVSYGVKREYILTENKSKNTYENLLFTKEILKENNFRSIIIISDPYHLPRAGLIARSLDIPYTVAPALDSPCWSTYTFLGIDYFRDGAALLAYILTGKISLL